MAPAGGTLTVPVGASNFGHSVAISGNTAVVGATDFTSTPGTAYTYIKAKGAAWSAGPNFTLLGPASTPRDDFGVVAISGGYVIVGAEDTGSFTGAAYIYKRAGGVWSIPTATLTYPSSAPGDQFGISVAISGSAEIVGTGSYAPDGAAFIYQK